MTLTLTLGWWLAPLIVTLCSFGCAKWISRDDGHSYGYAAAGAAAVSAIIYGLAVIVSLIAWLVWAVLK